MSFYHIFLLATAITAIFYLVPLTAQFPAFTIGKRLFASDAELLFFHNNIHISILRAYV